MTDARILKNGDLAIDMRSVEEWNPTVSQVREVAMSNLIVSPGMIVQDGSQYLPSSSETTNISKMVYEAVRMGRLIDFGFWPNEVIKECGRRGGPMYQRGGFLMPFRQPWVLMHSWEGALSVYLINPLEDHKPSGADFEAVELMAGKYHGIGLLAIGDRVYLTTPEVPPIGDVEYSTHVAPCVWRFIPGAKDTFNNGSTPEQAAVGNVLDPIMTGLMILATLGVRRETVEAPPKVNRARVKNGKAEIPPYDKVYSEEYVTALLHRGKRGRSEDQGGHHASPVPHIRRGHFRTYSSGRVSLIHDTMVRVSPEAREAFKASRTHYTVQPP